MTRTFLVRLVTRNDPGSLQLRRRLSRGGVSVLALTETVWVLSTVYGRDANQISSALEMLLRHRDLTIQDYDAALAALELFRSRPGLGFSDCMMIESARRAGHLPFGTFDRNLAKVEGAVRL